MSIQKTIAIFDVGKTNKKIFLFNEYYEKVFEKNIQLQQTVDEDGFECEDMHLLADWVLDSLAALRQLKGFEIAAINFTAYGASLVHLMHKGKRFLPLYNYLKPYPPEILQKFYSNFGGKEKLERETASPVEGYLNSGLQLFRLKHQKPERFNEIKLSLHLPQFLSYLVSGRSVSDITSIGCHTSLWNFDKQHYHEWVIEEGVHEKLAPVFDGTITTSIVDQTGSLISCGVGLHDSSSALIPYLVQFKEPFILISTGTWCISLNPFNSEPLTNDELANNGLCYLQYKGVPVKANRLFAGNEHEIETRRIADHFKISHDFYKLIGLDKTILMQLDADERLNNEAYSFSQFTLNNFSDQAIAYHALMKNIIAKQKRSTGFVMGRESIKNIYVDGGFGKNLIYLFLLAEAFPQQKIYAASLAQATALGAALAIHEAWNHKAIPENLVQLSKIQ